MYQKGKGINFWYLRFLIYFSKSRLEHMHDFFCLVQADSSNPQTVFFFFQSHFSCGYEVKCCHLHSAIFKTIKQVLF